MKRRTFSSLFAPYLSMEGDEERAAYALSFFLRTLIIVAALIAGVSAFAGLREAFLLSTVGAGLSVVLLMLMRGGFLRAASLLLILSWLTIAVIALVTGDGIHDVAIIILPVVLITGSLLLSRFLYTVVAVLSVVAVILVGVAEVVGSIETPFSEPGRWGDVVNVALILIGVALLIRFMTEVLHLGLERARRNEQNFREIFNATSEAVIIHDEDTGGILDVNDTFLAMTGLEREQAVAMPPALIYGESVLWEQIRQGSADAQRVIEFDLAVQSVQSPRIEVTFRKSIIGGQRCVLAVGRDITERRRLETRLRQSEKMQAIGELAGGIAHDFNNQLVGIVGYADILRNKLADRPALAEKTEKILNSARRASDLTAHLLAFARKGKFLAMAVDLHEIIEEVVTLLERSIDKRIRIELDFQARSATTMGDPSQLQNCLLNLALNARDAMPGGGELRFTTRSVHLDEDDCRMSPFAVEPGDYVEVSVIDTGVGMSQQVTDRIFEPFFTTKEKDKGTGMGLAAVYGTIKNHKGAISVYSEEGSGTNFRLFLPQSNAAPERRPAELDSIPVVEDAHLLLVDDEEVVCDTTAEMLRSLGYRVSICWNGEDALRVFRSHGETIDLVILDLVMPRMDGKATFEALRQVDPDVRVLLSSGYSRDGRAQEILDRGAVGFVQKPFFKNELARAVADALTDGDS